MENQTERQKIRTNAKKQQHSCRIHRNFRGYQQTINICRSNTPMQMNINMSQVPFKVVKNKSPSPRISSYYAFWNIQVLTQGQWLF